MNTSASASAPPTRMSSATPICWPQNTHSDCAVSKLNHACGALAMIASAFRPATITPATSAWRQINARLRSSHNAPSTQPPMPYNNPAPRLATRAIALLAARISAKRRSNASGTWTKCIRPVNSSPVTPRLMRNLPSPRDSAIALVDEDVIHATVGPLLLRMLEQLVRREVDVPVVPWRAFSAIARAASASSAAPGCVSGTWRANP